MQVNPCIFLAVLWIVSSPLCLSLSPDGLALLNLKKRILADPHGVLRKWNGEDETPCHWPGVSCIAGRVTIVHLGSNNLYGTIPKQLGNLGELRFLDLSQNKLVGEIPPELGNASKLTKLYLQNNFLQGSIPSELGSLLMLYELRLDGNKLVGDLPVGDSATHTSTTDKIVPVESLSGARSNSKGLCSLNNLTVGNFSLNYLTGKIPSCLQLPSSSFGWNCFENNGRVSNQRPSWQCGYSRSSHHSLHIPPQKKEATEHHHSRWKKHVQSAVAAGFCFAVIISAAVFFRFKHGAASVSPWRTHMSGVLQKTFVTGVPAMSRAELETACEDFSNIIGSSPESVVFKGTLSNGTEIAVTSIRASATSWARDSEIYFRYKVESLARINHKHLVKLLGYCAEDEPFTRMLVFEYAPNGTLFELLHNGEAEQLDWNARMRIVMGVAYGLEYMHHDLTPPASYSKFDSNSVYLTEDYAAKLADFEIWKPCLLKGEEKKTSSTGRNALSYDDLEGSGRESQDFEANIFGFGVLLLELITGRPPYCKDQGSLIDWASEYLNTPEVISYMVDPLLRFFNYNQLESLCEIVRLCTSSDSLTQPNMKKISSMLETALGISSEAAGPKSSPLLWAELAILTQM